MGFSERFPRWITLVIGIAQAVLTVAIIVLEFLSVYIDLAHGTIWIGFWAGLFFAYATVMMLFISKTTLRNEFPQFCVSIDSYF